MNKSRKVVLILIIVFLVIVCSIIISLYNLNKKVNKNSTNNNTVNKLDNEYLQNTDTIYDDSMAQKIDIDKILKYETVSTDYITMNALTENYINLIANKDTTKLNALLAPSYKEKYNINSNNMFKILTVPQLTDYRQTYKLTINEMLNAQIDETIFVYIIDSKCRISGTDNIFSLRVMFEVDTANKTYIIYPYQYINDKGYNKLKSGDKIDFDKEEIISSEYNTFNYISYNDNEMANMYFNEYMELLMYYQDDAYNMLDSEYSNKRFGNSNTFKAWIKENSKTIFSSQVNKYAISYKNNHKVYICVDNYNNYYIFNEQDGIMRSKVTLDNYTILSDTDTQKYQQATEVNKAKYQVETLIQKINMKDYKSIYDKLDSTFRNNNFKTVDSLKEYIKNNFYDINSIDVKDIYEEENYNVFKCEITNLRNNDETKQLTVVVSIKEGMDYAMSFSFE